MNNYIRKCLYRFTIANLTTQIRIREAIIKTLTEIGELNDCGMINDREFVHLGKELWMNS